MNHLENFPDIEKNRMIDVKILRWYSVCLTAKAAEINLPLAKAISDFVITGQWNVGTGYEKQQIDQMVGTPETPVK